MVARHRRAFAFAAGALLVAGILGLAARRAAAADPPPNRAEELFREARRLMDAKDYANACPKFAESEALDPAPGTLLNLGDCYEKNGQTGSAWATFQEAAKLASARNKQQYVTTANQRSAALQPKLSTLAVAPAKGSTPPQGIKISRDGKDLERSAWGVDVIVDPGPHVLAATAPGRKAWTSRIDVPSAKKIVAEVPALEAEPGSDEQRLVGDSITEPPKDEDRNEGPPTLRIVGLALAGVGVVGLGVGAFTGVHALGLRSDAASHCETYPSRCSPQARSANDDAKKFATVSTISLVAGGVLAAGGLALVLLAPGRGPSKRGMHVVPFGLAGAALEGTL